MGDNNIVIKITSEADLNSAQKQIEALVKSGEDLEAQYKRSAKEEKEEIALLKKHHKEGYDGLRTERELAESIEATRKAREKERKAIKNQIEETKKSIKSYNDQIKSYKTLNGMSGKAVQQLRAMREELQRMEDAGEFGSQAFMDLAVKAGELEDKISDTQQRIRVLASDTKEMDAAMGLGDGLAGTFYMATSGAELLGQDIEGLQQAFYKVQAVMSVVNGLQQVSNLLNRESNFNVVLSTKLLKNKTIARNAEAIATGKATVAQKLFNKVMLSNPAGFVLAALVAVVAAYTALSEILGRVGDKQARLNKIQTENKVNALRDATELEISLMQAQGKTALDVAKKTKEAKEEEVAILKDSYDKAAKAWEDANIFNRKKREEDMKEAKEAYEQAANELVQASDDVIVGRRTQQIDYEKSTTQITIGLMRDGAAKEIAQINQDYKERFKTLQGNSAEEVALRKALERQQAKEIREVRRKYALQAQQTAIQEQKNLLKAMSQSRGTEADYAQEIELTKKVAEAEAQARIDALEKEKMSAADYAAQVKAINLELADTLKQIDDEEANRKAEYARRLTDIELKEAEARKNALTGAEGVDEQKAILEDYYATRKKQIEENARLEKEAVERSNKTEEEKAASIKTIDAQLNADLVELKKEGAQAMLDVDSQYLADLEIAVSKSEDAISRAQGGDKLGALKEHYDAQLELYEAQQAQLKAKYDAGLITFQDYKQQEWEITKATTDAEVEYMQNAMQAISDGFQTALNYMQQASDLVFEALGMNVQAELDALNEMYTTDWEEAQKNADKKYITEKEYEKKKAALEMKQAKYAKAQALINAAINTATAVVTTLAQLGATPWGIAMAALAGSMGAAQIALIASKPLAQYEKGRKGGKGEYALVGEKGPEIMYVPAGASIVPNNLIATPESWSKFGVPELPHANPDVLRYAAEQTAVGLSIDYDRLGASVAAALPKQRAVTVNVDRSGVHVNNGGENHTYLNAKYTGTWN